MANEGSTKPDYFALCDEHRAFYEKNSLPYATCARCLLAASEQKRYAAEAENLRVRGLLQRTMDCEKCDNCDEHFDELDELLLRVAAPDAAMSVIQIPTDPKSVNNRPNACQQCGRDNPRVGFLCPICFMAHAEAVDFKCTGWKLVPENWQGAESADIGKLDAADKKIDGRGDDVVIGAESNVADLIAPPLRNERPSTVPEKVSAETGGEKAVPILKNSEDDRVGGE